MIADHDLERAVLGVVLLEPDRLDDVREAGLVAPHFADKRHEVIFQAAMALAARGGLPHPAGMAAQLREMPLGKNGQLVDVLDKCGGLEYLLSLMDSATTGANATFDALKLVDLAARRRVKETAEDVVRQADQPGFDARAQLTGIESAIIAAMDAMAPRSSGSSIRALADGALRSFEAIQEGGSLGLKTGYSDIDKVLGGMLPGSFVLVAGRPSMGKTSFSVCVMENVARAGGHVLFCSVEVSGALLVENLICSMAHIKPTTVRAGMLAASGWEPLTDAAATLSDFPITIDSSPEQSVATIAMSARRAAKRQPLALIVVDYLQLLRSGRRYRSRYEEVTDLSRDLKALARILNVPVMAVSQLSRDADKRKGKRVRPQMSDLRDSGAIEQDADQIMLLYRADYYEPDDPDVQGQAEVLIAKNRHGPTGTVAMVFQKEYLRFVQSARVPGVPAGWKGSVEK